MTDQALGADGTGFYLAGGGLTVAGASGRTIAGGRLVEVSVTACLLGSAGMDATLASWGAAESAGLDDVRAEDGRTVLPLQTQPMMLSSLPSSVRVQVRTTPDSHDNEDDWRLVLQFRNQAGSSLTWDASLPAEAFGAGWQAPLADLLTIDGAVADPAPTPAPTPAEPPAPTAAQPPAEDQAVTVVDHAGDEYYELLVGGQQAGLLVYHLIGSHLSITHTVIEPTYRGRGLSWELVGRALDDIRTKSVTVSNYCPVVSRFVDKNPEYGDLLSPPRPA
ncbi:N-acetyltransferase [Kribbella sp. NBC_00709]|uniref:GNAT family N-acetyltransferase n=1 Tax=Kribbella sp. NBC_00709 TaxID=2975972 RepID=UPI002E2A5E72|nr:GNAT family N-acetyltransferase [Kribbella sp. NBC_00709]